MKKSYLGMCISFLLLFLCTMNVSAVPTDISFESRLTKKGKLTLTVEAIGALDNCVYSIYGASKRSHLESSLEKATILGDRVASTNSLTIQITKVKKLKKETKKRRLFLMISARCGIVLKNSEIVTLKLRRSGSGLKNVKRWMKNAQKRFAKLNQDLDRVATTCDTDDEFDHEDFGPIFTATNVEVEVGETIADSSSILESDGSVRKYFFANGIGLKTATSVDGRTFAVSAGAVLPEGDAAHNKIFQLEDGTYKLFTTVAGSIVSYSTTDLLNFTLDSGVRVSEADAGIGMLSHLTIVPTKEGRFRGYFSSLPRPGETDFASRLIKSAISDDLINWTIEDGVRLGAGAPTLTDPAEQPYALPRGKRGVTLFYFKSDSESSTPIGMYYATSVDGLNFEQEEYLELNGNGPDGLQLMDGSYILYYDSGTPETGFSVGGGVLGLSTDDEEEEDDDD